MFGLAPVAFWKTEKAVCAKSRFSFLGLWALAFRFVFGMAQFATRQRQVKFKFQTDPLPDYRAYRPSARADTGERRIRSN